ncbi:hypothetical protein H4R18_004278 [Coemansia javaensis]|uniref:CHCH domain-containing protein n=1 Tax=Coemansia javaensis TaxID=2761396 RepID=A0A9W8H854_9FUNG|nr:hypothetical protein H4R18_004278 [Coemansia javaensis]
MPGRDPPQPARPAPEDDNDDDAWDRRIRRTGCFAENERVLICHADTGDWRRCADEVAAFRRCMELFARSQSADQRGSG